MPSKSRSQEKWWNTLLLKRFVAKRTKLKLDDVNLPNVLKRVAIGFVGAAWLGILPGYLLTIHMVVERFFAYDMFTDALYSQAIFMAVAFALFCAMSMVLYGFLLPMRTGLDSYRENRTVSLVDRGLFVLLLVFSVIGFTALIWLAWVKSLPVLFFGPVFFATVIAISMFSMTGKGLWQMLGDWRRPAFLIAITTLVPFTRMEETSEFVKIGLSVFAVGGGIETVVTEKSDTGAELARGELLLRSPNYAFIRNGEQGLTVIHLNENTIVKVGGEKRP